MYLPADWIIHAIFFGAGFIADEDHRSAPIIQFPHIWPHGLQMSQAPERTKVMYTWTSPVPCLVGCLAVNTPSWFTVEDVDRRRDGFSLKSSWHPFCLQQTSCHPNHSLVAPLDDVVLLRRVWCREETLDSTVCTVLPKLR